MIYPMLQKLAPCWVELQLCCTLHISKGIFETVLCYAVQAMGAYGHSLKPKVLVMSYPTFRIYKAEVYKLGIDVVVCDEAHFLKNGDSQITQAVSQIPAKRRLLVSGTSGIHFNAIACIFELPDKCSSNSLLTRAAVEQQMAAVITFCVLLQALQYRMIWRSFMLSWM